MQTNTRARKWAAESREYTTDLVLSLTAHYLQCWAFWSPRVRAQGAHFRVCAKTIFRCTAYHHICGKPCRLADKAGCLKRCSKVCFLCSFVCSCSMLQQILDHQDDVHVCQAPVHENSVRTVCFIFLLCLLQLTYRTIAKLDSLIDLLPSGSTTPRSSNHSSQPG